MGARISKWWKKSSKLKKASVILLLIVLAIVAAVWFFITSYFNYNYNSITGKPENLGFENVIDKDVVNVALFGIDSRGQNFKGNSDSIMVLSLNTKSKQVKIVSIMRDSLVKIDKNGNVVPEK